MFLGKIISTCWLVTVVINLASIERCQSETTPAPVTMATAAVAAMEETVLRGTARTNETFNDALLNITSPEFMARAEAIRNILTTAFNRNFPTFLRIAAVRFRRGSIINEVDMVFNTTSVMPPNATQIVSVVREVAVNIIALNGIDITNVTVRPGSPTTTLSPSTNASAQTPAPVTRATAAVATPPTPTPLVLVLRLTNLNFTDDLLNSTSQGFMALASQTEQELTPFFRRRFPTFLRLAVTAFRRGSIIANLNIVYNTTSVMPPNATQILSVVREAAENITAFNIDANNITVGPGSPTTTLSPSTTNVSTNASAQTPAPVTMATAAVAAMETVLRGTARTNETFNDALLDITSPEFMARAEAIRNILTTAFNRNFPTFLRIAAVRFRRGSIINEVDMVFNTTSVMPPNATQIVSVLREVAVNITALNGIDITNVTVDLLASNGIDITNITVGPVPPSTSPPMTTAAPSPSTSPPMTTAAPSTTAVLQSSRLVSFRTDDNFNIDLLDSSSAAFIARANLITSELEPFFRRRFASFTRINVISFRNGSIIQDIQAFFTANALPSIQEVIDVIRDAARNIDVFNIDLNSITVDGQTCSGVSHGSSLITALFFVALSLLLSTQS